MFLLFEFCCGTLPSCLKVKGWVGGDGLQHLSVSPRPLGSLLGLSIGFGTKGLGPRLDNISIFFKGSLRKKKCISEPSPYHKNKCENIISTWS